MLPLSQPRHYLPCT